MNNTYFGIFITIAIYCLMQELGKKLGKAWFNPLVATLIIIISTMVILDIPYESYKPSGDMIAWFLTPATVCLAVPLYRQFNVLRSNKLAILASCFAGSLSSVVSIFAMSKLLGLTSELHISLAPKSVTTAIASSISEELGGIVSLTVASVIVTGVLGSVLAIPLKKVFRLRSDVAWGLATGTACHAGGTAAIIKENDVAGAMSSLSIIIAGIIHVVLVPLVVGLY